MILHDITQYHTNTVTSHGYIIIYHIEKYRKFQNNNVSSHVNDM